MCRIGTGRANVHIDVSLGRPLPSCSVHKCGNAFLRHFLDTLPNGCLSALCAHYDLACRLVQRVKVLLLVRDLRRLVHGSRRSSPCEVPHNGVDLVQAVLSLLTVHCRRLQSGFFHRHVSPLDNAVRNKLAEPLVHILDRRKSSPRHCDFFHISGNARIFGNCADIFPVKLSESRKLPYLPLSRWNVRPTLGKIFGYVLQKVIFHCCENV